MASDEQLNRLLAGRDRMSRIGKERAFEAVYDEVSAAERPASHRRPWLIAALAGATALAAVVPIVWMTRSSSDDGAFTRRGSEAASFQLRCGPRAELGQCAAGETLVFDIAGTGDDRSSFAAFARREADGLIIWYFPATEAGTSLDLARHTEHGIVDMGVMIGPEHRTGTYRVYGVFAAAPMSRDDVKSAVEAGDIGSDSVAIVTRALEVR